MTARQSARDAARQGWEVVLSLLGIIVLVGVDISLQVYALTKRRPDAMDMDEARVQLAVLKSLDATHERAMSLVRRNQHLEAGLLLADVASARRVLSPQIPGGLAGEPDVSERLALQQFRQAGVGNVYAAFLQIRYPKWSAGDGQPAPKPTNSSETP